MYSQSPVNETSFFQFPIVDAADNHRSFPSLFNDGFGPAITYTCWPKRASEECYFVSSSFGELACRCSHRPPVTRNYNDVLFSPFAYGVGHGNVGAPRECNFFAFNIENACPGVTLQEHVLSCVDGLASFVYPTRAHSSDKPRGANYQLFVALRMPIPVEHYKHAAIRFAHRFSSLDAGVNSSYVLTDQKIAFPSCTLRSGLDGFRVSAQRGRAFDWLPDLLDVQALSPRGAH
jgi:hypothetical protein